MMTVALTLIGLCTGVLVAYAALHYWAALGFLLLPARGQKPDSFPDDSVVVWVPARHEGERALRALSSLTHQDHRGFVEVVLLLADATDSAVPFLERAFPGVSLREADAGLVELWHTPTRRGLVAFTGLEAKSAKLNWIAPQLDARYAAILDSDHQARPDWLRTSIALLQAQGGRVIQGRRQPLSARGLFALWDALHQHVGCELWNTLFARLNLTVFISGTTVVMERSLLVAHPLGSCLTEDTDWSYDLVLAGEKILTNPYSGSDEELSPDLYSFVARRRRWANGHTETFLRHLPQLWRAPLSLGGKLQFLLHGVHYLVAVPVFGLHLLIGLLVAHSLPLPALWAALTASLLLGAELVRTQRTLGTMRRLSEAVVVFAWLAPAAIILANLAYAVRAGDWGHAALPLPGVWQVLGLLGLVAPLWVLAAGMLRFRQLGLGTFLAVLASFPVAFYLDLSAVLVGLGDFVVGRAFWRPVNRSTAPAAAAGAAFPAPLQPTVSIRDSYRMRTWLRRLLEGELPKASLPRPTFRLAWGIALSVLFTGVWCASPRVELSPHDCQVLKHDGEPWIVPPAKLPDYCGPKSQQGVRAVTQQGSFIELRADTFATLDAQFWERPETTFACNQAMFTKANVQPNAAGGLSFKLLANGQGDKPYTAGAIVSRAEQRFLYGRFEAVLKPAKTSGVISAFFLYRFDPWQEIDAEFIGKDTTKLLANVYYNPGEEGDLYNYGYAGTPVLIDLGFDASLDFHHYAVEWQPDGIGWYVDGKLVHYRGAGRPTPVPHLPMRFHVNAWPICSAALAGPLDAQQFPTAAHIKSVTISTWSPSFWQRLGAHLRGLFGMAEPQAWREQATWVQPLR